jgi:uncharacterized protein
LASKPDYQLLLALLAPLLVWPWVAAWEQHPANGVINSIALFTLIPFVEEIMFRGLLQGWLLEKSWFSKTSAGVSRANWLSSFTFAAAHVWQHALLLAPGYLAVSLVLGHFRERYRGIAVPVLLHGYYNLGLLLVSN